MGVVDVQGIKMWATNGFWQEIGECRHHTALSKAGCFHEPCTVRKWVPFSKKVMLQNDKGMICLFDPDSIERCG